QFLYIFAKPFVIETMDINRKRLRLSEISILARDTSDSSYLEMDSTPEEVASVRIAIRMQLIREFLSGQLSKFVVEDSPDANSGVSIPDATKEFAKSLVSSRKSKKLERPAGSQ
ncbi:MAG: hypothetical protein U1D69_09785, partial [Polynucleobacter sp.]|nr:hypothetical protein [Polynucleobacter sp.]